MYDDTKNNKTMYGSHNTFTAYPVRRWYMHILQPFARCQRTTIEQQIACGARAFDLRVRFDGKGGLVACHGLVEYKADVPAVVARLENAGCCYRIILENVMGGRKVASDDLDRLKAIFLTKEFPHCLYVSDKRSWNTTYNIHCKIRLGEQNRHGGTGCIIPRLWVRKYKYYKAQHAANLDTETIHYYDFVDIK